MTRLVRYFFVGGAAALFDLLFFLLFHNGLGFHYMVVGVTGFVLATFLNYVLSIRWVFASGVRFKKSAEIAMVYFVSTVGLAIHATVLAALVEMGDFPPLAAKIGAIAAAFFWNFGVRNYYVFAAAR